MTRTTTLTLVLTATVLVAAQPAQTPDAADRIRAEGLERSQAARVFETLASEIGPRLTASPGHVRAAKFARDEFAAYGLTDARLEGFTFGRGWSLDRLAVEMTAPRYMPLIAYANAWSPSTRGEITGTPVCVCGKSIDDLSPLRSRLAGAIVFTEPPLADFVREDRPQPTDADDRVTSPAAGTGAGAAPDRGKTRAPSHDLLETLREAGAAAIVVPSGGEHGTVFVTGHDAGAEAIPTITLSAEHYNMVVRLLQKETPVTLRVDLRATFHDDDGGKAYNVLADLPGSDKIRKSEVVMIGGHLDSWHTSPGATDNADGAATVIEAMRILAASGVKPRRTIRAALWGGEEQGLLGARAWVAAHLAGDAHAAERGNFACYFNVDAGTGKISGWYLQNHTGARPLLDGWLAPLRDLGGRANVLRAIGASDHVPFMLAGVPSFTAIQDFTGYDTRTHHTNMDTPERVRTDDIRQAAIVLATFAYRAAMADETIARPDLTWLRR